MFLVQGFGVLCFVVFDEKSIHCPPKNWLVFPLSFCGQKHTIREYVV